MSDNRSAEIFESNHRLLSGKSALRVAVVAGMLSGCAIKSIDSIDEVSACDGEETPIVATYVGADNYSEQTDPVKIVARQREAAEQKQEETDLDLGVFTQIIGRGTVACTTEIDGASVEVLTLKGAEISAEIESENQS